MNLLNAWRQASVQDNWQLVLAGPDENGYRQALVAEIDRLGLCKSVRFLGPLNDEEKWQAYANADVFVLPSFSENFGIVVAEALAAGVPVITTKETPWSDVEELGFGWWIPPTVPALTSTIKSATRMSKSELKDMMLQSLPWIECNFGWPAIGIKMYEFYEWLLGSGDRPKFVMA